MTSATSEQPGRQAAAGLGWPVDPEGAGAGAGTASTASTAGLGWPADGAQHSDIPEGQA